MLMELYSATFQLKTVIAAAIAGFRALCHCDQLLPHAYHDAGSKHIGDKGAIQYWF